jgi:hypothetical protein
MRDYLELGKIGDLLITRNLDKACVLVLLWDLKHIATDKEIL